MSEKKKRKPKKSFNFTQDASNATLAERLSRTGGFAPSGRGHGRIGRKKREPKPFVPTPKKLDMLYFVRDVVRHFRTNPVKITDNMVSSLFPNTDTRSWAYWLTNHFQFFDCSEIQEYAVINVKEAYADFDAPPHPDSVLPAENVGLYVTMDAMRDQDGDVILEMLLLCMSFSPTNPHQYLVWNQCRGQDYMLTEPTFLGEISVKDEDPYFKTPEETSFTPDETRAALCYTAFLLQTINQPRFVKQSKREVSQLKRQSFKKVSGRFSPDSWNLVSWNVDEPVTPKIYEEGTGSKQGLHFRRGHWRKAEKDWERARWSTERNRWEQYIHGYEAGHPAFGVKKSYHLPRKENK